MADVPARPVADIILQPVDAVWFRVLTDPATFNELYDFFTFYVETWQLDHRTGKRVPRQVPIHLLKKRTQFLPAGLIKYIQAFADDRHLTIEGSNVAAENWSIADTERLMSRLQPCSRSERITPHQHQITAITKVLRFRRRVLLSATASGKSLIAYALARELTDRGLKGLIIVPTISLVEQMYKDFADYSSQNGWAVSANVHRIYGTKAHTLDYPITISTWQSLHNDQELDLSQLDFVIGDEAHNFAARSLAGVMERMTNAHWRIGMSGTLDDAKAHQLSIIGHFGPVVEVAKSADLIKQGLIADLVIKCLVLQYPTADRDRIALMDYQGEVDWLVANERRNRFIANLALSLEGNTLVLFQYVEKHGKQLHQLMTASSKRQVFFVYGGTDVEDRERVRELLEQASNAIAVASNGVFSTGSNIRNLHNIVFASPTKSRIRVLQSIGRGLRLGDHKDRCTLYDIVDDLHTDTHTNFALKHFVKRRRMYDQEQFPTKVYNVAIGG